MSINEDRLQPHENPFVSANWTEKLIARARRYPISRVGQDPQHLQILNSPVGRFDISLFINLMDDQGRWEMHIVKKPNPTPPLSESDALEILRNFTGHLGSDGWVGEVEKDGAWVFQKRRG